MRAHAAAGQASFFCWAKTESLAWYASRHEAIARYLCLRPPTPPSLPRDCRDPRRWANVRLSSRRNLVRALHRPRRCSLLATYSTRHGSEASVCGLKGNSLEAMASEACCLGAEALAWTLNTIIDTIVISPTHNHTGAAPASAPGSCCLSPAGSEKTSRHSLKKKCNVSIGLKRGTAVRIPSLEDSVPGKGPKKPLRRNVVIPPCPVPTDLIAHIPRGLGGNRRRVSRQGGGRVAPRCNYRGSLFVPSPRWIGS